MQRGHEGMGCMLLPKTKEHLVHGQWPFGCPKHKCIAVRPQTPTSLKKDNYTKLVSVFLLISKILFLKSMF